ncbi:MAG TPA: TlpA disulfide reductase family protein, partial [Bdellovibrionota bacterium]|nr:TlpA disulfide reductase family protein [Bdellovibrionota bacterium]
TAGLFVIRTQSGKSAHDHAAAEHADIQVGSQLPDFLIKKYGSGEVRASELGHKVTLINFWATWCQPCVTELPSIVKLRRKFKPEGFEVVAINVDESPDEVLPGAIKRYGLDFTVYLDPEQKLSELFDVTGLPLTVVIDRNRKILFVEKGGRDWIDDASQKMVKGWLAG